MVHLNRGTVAEDVVSAVPNRHPWWVFPFTVKRKRTTAEIPGEDGGRLSFFQIRNGQN
jgi:hypothetical protein